MVNNNSRPILNHQKKFLKT